MDVTKLIEIIKEDFQDANKNNGIEQFKFETVVKYLDDLDNSVIASKQVEANNAQFSHENNLAHYNAKNQSDLAGFNAEVQSNIEMFRSVISFSQTALKSAILLNGGAATAMLAFIGNIWIKGVSQDAKSPLIWSVAFFSIGLLCAVLSTSLAYMTQRAYQAENESKADNFVVAIAIIIILSYILFGVGGWQAARAFFSHLPTFVAPI